MSDALPKNPQQLRRMLARKLGLAALVIGAAVGGGAYFLETRRTEHAALERALEGGRHFESPSMQMVMLANTSDSHAELRRLLDRNRFIGVRVFSSDKKLTYEIWEDVPAELVEAAHAQQLRWPGVGENQETWTPVGGEQLIQVVLPLFGKDHALAGYVAGVSRLDEPTLRAQREQIVNGALTAAASVFATSILLYPLLLAMLRQTTAQSRRLLDANLSLLHSLGNAAAKRDSDTDAHNYRVTIYAVALAEALALPNQEIADLVTGAFLHDVGKIGIPDSILLKPGKLTSEEFEVMKTHTLLGLEIVEGNPWLQDAAQVIRSHHERFDGKGYPDGLCGESIPQVARIFAVVDVFDALTSERPYKSALAFNEAMTAVEQGDGTHFDSEAVAAFKGIAFNLHACLAKASEDDLRLRLQQILVQYFGEGRFLSD